MQPKERVIRGGGLEIATEAFGDPAHPAVILIMGGMASMLRWPEGFRAGRPTANNDRTSTWEI